MNPLLLYKKLSGTFNTKVADFSESTAVVLNYNQGWMNEPAFPDTVTYWRGGWWRLNPALGVYDWSSIDADIAACGPNETVSIRVNCTNPFEENYRSTTPEWVFSAGAQYVTYYTSYYDMTRWCPLYDDPIFLYYHNIFLTAMGAKYANHPKVSSIDVGSYGTWGEWHTLSGGPPDLPISTEKKSRFLICI